MTAAPEPSRPEEGLPGEDALRQTIAKYRFYHIIRLTDRVETPGNPAYVSTQKLVLEALGKADVRGKRVLDIGCRDGLLSFEAERRG
ncbi:MAG TPA: hypothetical protein VFK70_02840, partial [Vicinamibacteria bacterium]|nr:hypothetical protein [Vicinamibacteria bacterium]